MSWRHHSKVLLNFSGLFYEYCFTLAARLPKSKSTSCCIGQGLVVSLPYFLTVFSFELDFKNVPNPFQLNCYLSKTPTFWRQSASFNVRLCHYRTQTWVLSMKQESYYKTVFHEKGSLNLKANTFYHYIEQIYSSVQAFCSVSWLVMVECHTMAKNVEHNISKWQKNHVTLKIETYTLCTKMW